jgi:fatty acid desaturase
VWKVSSNLALAGSAWALVAWSSSFWAQLLSAFLIALFWQQCGWLAHDFLHHQVFQNRALGDLAGIIIGNVFQGFSVAWWKNKHNTHHAVPNLVESSPDAHDGDPDIDTMPILAWSLTMAKKSQDSKWGRFFVRSVVCLLHSPPLPRMDHSLTRRVAPHRHQALMYFPILLLARVSWLMQSFLFVFDNLPGSDLWATKGAEAERQVSLVQCLAVCASVRLMRIAWHRS